MFFRGFRSFREGIIKISGLVWISSRNSEFDKQMCFSLSFKRFFFIKQRLSWKIRIANIFSLQKQSLLPGLFLPSTPSSSSLFLEKSSTFPFPFLIFFSKCAEYGFFFLKHEVGVWKKKKKRQTVCCCGHHQDHLALRCRRHSLLSSMMNIFNFIFQAPYSIVVDEPLYSFFFIYMNTGTNYNRYFFAFKKVLLCRQSVQYIFHNNNEKNT